MKKENISDAVIRRLPRYYRQLTDLCGRGIVRISSHSLGQEMNITASQIRQDFSCFGEFGQQGYGYNVEELRSEIGHILGDRQRPSSHHDRRGQPWSRPAAQFSLFQAGLPWWPPSTFPQPLWVHL